MLRRTLRTWRDALHFVKLDTVLRSHRKGREFKRMIEALRFEELVTAKGPPWQNCVIGTLRHECSDHVIPLGKTHLFRTLAEYVRYYNESRTHQSLNGDSPIGRRVEGKSAIVATPVLGGLHHRYSRAA